MKVMIATPTYKGIGYVEFLDSLEGTVNLLTLNGIEPTFKLVTGCTYVQVARNKICKEFLNSDCDKLLFIDDDMSWNPVDAYKLVSQDCDFIAGIYSLRQEPEYYPVVILCDDNGYPIPEGNFLQAIRVPTGFMCITRKVLDMIREANPHLEYIESPLGKEEFTEFFDYFPQGVKNKRWIGEDYAFCDMWTELGGKIYVPPDITLTHHMPDKAYVGNFWNFMKKQRGGIDYEEV